MPKVINQEEKELAAAAAAIMGVDEVDPSDFWRCPGCHKVSSYAPWDSDAMPMNWGDAYSTHCPHCRLSFAPRELEDGSPNPIMHPCYTHEEVDDESR